MKLKIFKDPATEQEFMCNVELVGEIPEMGLRDVVPINGKREGSDKVEKFFLNKEGINFAKEVNGVQFTRSGYGAFEKLFERAVESCKDFVSFAGHEIPIGDAKYMLEALETQFVPSKHSTVCGYCGRLLGDDNYPKPTVQGIDFEIPENAERVEGSCCIAKERLGAF
jgi:hypothetical protein